MGINSMFMPILNAYSAELEYEALIIKKLFGENLTIDNYLFHTSDRLFRQSEQPPHGGCHYWYGMINTNRLADGQISHPRC